jgi:predicted RNA-binding Zn ribbon-like protein
MIVGLEHDIETSSAPGDLETIRSFVNTLDVEEATDELDSTAGLAGWLAETGLGDGAEPTDQELARAVDFREGLRSLLLANNGVDTGDDSADRLNAALDGASSEVRFQGASAEIVPTCGNVDGALATMSLVVHGAMQSGDWARLKVCPADDCHWAFYDRSRNHSRTWCQMGDCGNRAKVRAFRARKTG